MDTRVSKQGYRIDSELFQFVETEVLPGLALESETFWSGAARILGDFMPRNQALLATRVKLQAQIDAFHLAPDNRPLDPVRYQQFLTDIGYLVPEPADFQITTEHVDPEVAQVAGPQLVVPLMNARVALNAANARWGSLYDALYGSDVIADHTEGAPIKGYDPCAVVRFRPMAGIFSIRRHRWFKVLTPMQWHTGSNTDNWSLT